MKKKRTKVKCISLLEDGRYYLEITLTSSTGQRIYRRRTCPPGLTLDEAQGELVQFRTQQRIWLQQTDQGLAQVITVADYAERWMPIKAPDLGASTTDRYIRDLSLHILPVLGEKRVRSLTRIDVKAWVACVQDKRKADGELYSWETLEGWWRILRQLLDALAVHRRGLIARQHPGLDTGLLFPSRNGTHRNSGSLTKVFKKACDEAGITIRVSAQVLRRTFNTLMLEAAVDRAVLWSMIGHSDERLSRRYAGVSLEAKKEAVESVLVLPSPQKVAPECCTTEQCTGEQEMTKPLVEGLR